LSFFDPKEPAALRGPHKWENGTYVSVDTNPIEGEAIDPVPADDPVPDDAEPPF
jgi:hypothetical protein